MRPVHLLLWQDNAFLLLPHITMLSPVSYFMSVTDTWRPEQNVSHSIGSIQQYIFLKKYIWLKLLNCAVDNESVQCHANTWICFTGNHVSQGIIASIRNRLLFYWHHKKTNCNKPTFHNGIYARSYNKRHTETWPYELDFEPDRFYNDLMVNQINFSKWHCIWNEMGQM